MSSSSGTVQKTAGSLEVGGSLVVDAGASFQSLRASAISVGPVPTFAPAFGEVLAPVGLLIDKDALYQTGMVGAANGLSLVVTAGDAQQSISLLGRAGGLPPILDAKTATAQIKRLEQICYATDGTPTAPVVVPGHAAAVATYNSYGYSGCITVTPAGGGAPTIPLLDLFFASPNLLDFGDLVFVNSSGSGYAELDVSNQKVRINFGAPLIGQPYTCQWMVLHRTLTLV